MTFKLQNKIGIWGEKLAENYYLKRGYVLVARNVYNFKGKRLGEIDLVVRSETELIFVEVKVRRNDRFGSPQESVTRAKQKKLLKIVHWFCRAFPCYQSLTPRIDVCAITTNIDKTVVNVIIIPSAVTLDN